MKNKEEKVQSFSALEVLTENIMIEKLISEKQ